MSHNLQSQRSSTGYSPRVTSASAGPATGSIWHATRTSAARQRLPPIPMPGATASTSFIAFNTDKPFDRFVREQLAGDLLPAATAEERVANQIATGYLALIHVIAADRDPEKRKLDVIDDQLDVLGKNFLGISLTGCARCHDHKIDPLPTRDYYSLAGIFRSTTSVRGGYGSLAPGSVATGETSPDAPVWMRGENLKVMGVRDDQDPTRRADPPRWRGGR